MPNFFLKTILITFLCLVNLIANGQYQKSINRIDAQLSPAWVHTPQNARLEALSSFSKIGSESNVTNAKSLSQGQHFHSIQKVNTYLDETLPAYKENEVFIKFKDAVSKNIKTFDQARHRSSSISLGRLNTVMSSAKIDRLKKIANSEKLKNVSNIYKAALEKGISLEKAIEILKESPDIEYVEKVPRYYALQSPNDPFYVAGNQYALDLVHAAEAFELQNNSNEIFVAIVDDAFYYEHPDLIGNVDVSKCYDVADADADTRPPTTGTNKAGPLTFSHGTHVGGIVGAVTNNAQGIAAVSNNQVKIFGIKATSDDTEETRDIEKSFEGVLKAIANGADVINMSFGGTGDSRAWQDMINDATAQGVIFVAAAGNGNTSAKNYPAAYENVIAVSNTDENDQKNPSSHYGSWVSIAAPGSSILSTVVGDDGISGSYATYSGTSMSSPMVAGLVGLILSENDALNYSQVLSILQNSSDDISARNPGFESLLGAGRINAYNAMLLARGEKITPIADLISSEPEIFVGQSVTFSSQSLGNDLSYSWSFQGGSPIDGAGKTVEILYNTPGVYDVSLTVSNSNGSDLVAFSDYVVVVEPQECAILSFPFPGTRAFYSYVDDETDANNGPVVGQNINGFTKFANLYDYLPGNYISGGLFAIGKIVSNNPENAVISFKVWEESTISNLPGREIASQDIAYSDLKLTGQNQSNTNKETYSEIIFDKPPAIPADGRFYMGFEIYYEEGDTIGFYTNDDGEGNGNESFALFEGNWVAFSEFEFAANIEMSPILAGGSYLNVNPFVAEAGACQGNTISFNTDGMQQNVSVYKWTFEGGIPATSSLANPIVTYNNLGEFEAELLVTFEGCEEAKRRFTQTIKIVNCEEKLEADFIASRLAIEAGDSIQFFENSPNATGYLWNFEGGFPLTSALADPFVIYSEPGIYKVSLEVSNPVGDLATIVKEEYIQVYEEGVCNFYREYEVSNFPSSVSPTLYESDGYISGTGSGDLAKVEFFDISPSTAYLKKLEIAFGTASSNDNTATVDVVIYDNNGINGEGVDGVPGEIIAVKSVLISEIAEDITNDISTAVVFDDPVLLDGPFYAGILLQPDNADTVAILSTEDDEVSVGTSWELLSTNVWVPTSERWSTGAGENPLDISLLITAFVTEANDDAADFCQPLSVDEEVNNNIRVYPNPFELSTIIEYAVDSPTEVKLEIFNSIGHKVLTLEDSFKSKGVHQAVLNAGNLSRGMYIYRLQVGDDKAKSGRVILK